MLRLFESLLKVKKSVVHGVSARSTAVTLTLSVNLMSGKSRRRGKGEEPRERSRDENKKGRKGSAK